MTNRSQNTNEICHRYANALIISASDKDELIEISKNFKHFTSTIQSSLEFSKFINNPLINSKKKSELLSNLCKKLSYNNIFQGFIKVLAKHGKILFYKKIFNEFRKSLDIRDGLTEIVITTAEPLEKETEEQLKQKLSNVLKLKIKLKKIVKKEIIGGVIIKINSIMIDNSIKSKLVDFKI